MQTTSYEPRIHLARSFGNIQCSLASSVKPTSLDTPSSLPPTPLALSQTLSPTNHVLLQRCRYDSELDTHDQTTVADAVPVTHVHTSEAEAHVPVGRVTATL